MLTIKRIYLAAHLALLSLNAPMVFAEPLLDKGSGNQAIDAQPQQPNVLLIVADDMGWADLGSFGSEIHTPNLDALAAKGLTMTQFRVAPTCSPTRSMLLTGLDNHPAGVGTMQYIQAPNQLGSVNYAAQLHDGVVTVAEVLASKGYSTAMAGKWHLATTPENYPHRRGFQQSFSLLQGGASHFSDRSPLHQGYQAEYLEDGQAVQLPDDFYSSIHYTDKIIEYLDKAEASKPFFAYLAYTAPHDPLQVPDDWLERYRGVYDQGPKAVRQARHRRQLELGLVPKGAPQWTPPEFPEWLPMGRKPWLQRSEAERKRDARSMEIYAAMIELLDQQIGRLHLWLETRGLLENTVIIFMSDNGANAATPLIYPHTSREWFLTERKQGLEDMGRMGSHTFQGIEWASVSNTPHRLYKTTVAEGGVRVPFIVSGPGVVSGERSKQAAAAIDITPTLLEFAGIDSNNSAIYQAKLQPQGRSLVDVWQHQKSLPERNLGIELFGNRALVRGRWKAINLKFPVGSGKWQLFDLVADPGATKNLASVQPEILQQLIDAYENYAQENGVIPPNPPPSKSSAVLYTGACNWWCEFKFDTLDAVIAAYTYITD